MHAEETPVARLLIKSDGFDSRTLELRLGINRLGRASHNDFQLEHPSISSTHCEIELLDGQVRICDCNSTNGTFVSGEPIKEVKLTAGQCFRVGMVEIEVENTEVSVAIPQFKVARPAPPVVQLDGSLICPRHPHSSVTHQCSHCKEVLCDACVSRLRRRGGKKTLLLCGLCSHHCFPIGKEKKKKRSLLEIFQKTVKLPFAREKPSAE
jgi:hypothetical protein